MRKGAASEGHGHLSFAPQRRQEIHTRGLWHFPLLRAMRQQHHACSAGVYCHTTGKPN